VLVLVSETLVLQSHAIGGRSALDDVVDTAPPPPVVVHTRLINPHPYYHITSFPL